MNKHIRGAALGLAALAVAIPTAVSSTAGSSSAVAAPAATSSTAKATSLLASDSWYTLKEQSKRGCVGKRGGYRFETHVQRRQNKNGVREQRIRYAALKSNNPGVGVTLPQNVGGTLAISRSGRVKSAVKYEVFEKGYMPTGTVSLPNMPKGRYVHYWMTAQWKTKRTVISKPVYVKCNIKGVVPIF